MNKHYINPKELPDWSSFFSQIVVTENVYIVNYRPEQAAIVGEYLAQYFEAGRLPALNLIGVQSLAIDTFLIEIDAEAVVNIQ